MRVGGFSRENTRTCVAGFVAGLLRKLSAQGPPHTPKTPLAFYTSEDGLLNYTVSHLHCLTAIVLRVYLKSFEKLISTWFFFKIKGIS